MAPRLRLAGLLLLALLCLCRPLAAQLGVQNVCERQGLCKRCSAEVFSFYRCSAAGKCWDSEVCIDGFCCIRDSLPVTNVPTTGTGGGGNGNALLCPDTSAPLSAGSKCYSDASCAFLGANCVMGKCCATCTSRRSAVLAGRAAGYIPDCGLDGRYWMARQCRNNADCWCTNIYGLEIAGTRPAGFNCQEQRRLHQAQYPPNTDCGGRTRTTNVYACARIASLAPSLDHRCDCDTDCAGGQYTKCCLTSNGRRCTDTGSGGGGSGLTCPRDSVDTPGAFCTLDAQCEAGRRCCPVTNALGTAAVNRRCICADANEVYTQCYRNLCAGTGREPACTSLGSCGGGGANNGNLTPMGVCRAGCYCRSGYVRRNDASGAACVSVNRCSTGTGQPTPGVYYARAAIAPAYPRSQQAAISGTIELQQTLFNGVLRLSGQLNGLPAGEHAIAVMEYGDVSRNCRSLGGHYNPTGVRHGAPSATSGHAGDLGNVLAAGFATNTVARLDVSSTRLRLADSDQRAGAGILGRAIAVYAQRDDYGLGGAPKSLVDGNAGDVIACGVIVAVSGR